MKRFQKNFAVSSHINNSYYLYMCAAVRTEAFLSICRILRQTLANFPTTLMNEMRREMFSPQHPSCAPALWAIIETSVILMFKFQKAFRK